MRAHEWSTKLTINTATGRVAKATTWWLPIVYSENYSIELHPEHTVTSVTRGAPRHRHGLLPLPFHAKYGQACPCTVPSRWQPPANAWVRPLRSGKEIKPAPERPSPTVHAPEPNTYVLAAVRVVARWPRHYSLNLSSTSAQYVPRHRVCVCVCVHVQFRNRCALTLA